MTSLDHHDDNAYCTDSQSSKHALEIRHPLHLQSDSLSSKGAAAPRLHYVAAISRPEHGVCIAAAAASAGCANQARHPKRNATALWSGAAALRAP